MKVNTISLYRAHRKFWIAFAVTAIFNFLAIKGKKLWIWRKEKLAAAAAQVQIQQEEAPQNGLGMIFNNVIHNKDVISSKLFTFIVVAILCLGLSILLSDDPISMQPSRKKSQSKIYLKEFQQSLLLF